MNNRPDSLGSLPASPEFIDAHRMGFAVAAADMAGRIGRVEFLNARMPWDPRQCQVSPGIRLLALMIGCLVGPLALYRLAEFSADFDCAVLLGAERQPADFHDDAMGRALIKLFDSPVGQTYAGLCRQAVERLALPATDTAHADTTSITVFGQYPDQEAGSLPADGYNKDGHPECKQLVAGVVARPDGIPLEVDVCDGNQNDTTWSRQALLGTGGTVTADVRAQILFVADSKLLSHETVADLCESSIRFVSRLPNTFGLERATKAATAAGPWEPVGPLSARNDAASYRICETPGQLGGHDVRFMVVHSSALEAKARHQEVARLEKDAQRPDRAIRAGDQGRFACVADATTAWEEWQQTKAITQSTGSVAGAIVEIPPDGPTSWKVQVARTEPATPRIQAERLRRSTFILVSNDPRRSARELLEADKTQFVVEHDHAVVKGPLSIAPLFLKDTDGNSLDHEVLVPVSTPPGGRLRRSRSALTITQRQARLLLGMDSRRFIQVPSG